MTLLMVTPTTPTTTPTMVTPTTPTMVTPTTPTTPTTTDDTDDDTDDGDTDDTDDGDTDDDTDDTDDGDTDDDTDDDGDTDDGGGDDADGEGVIEGGSGDVAVVGVDGVVGSGSDVTGGDTGESDDAEESAPSVYGDCAYGTAGFQTTLKDDKIKSFCKTQEPVARKGTFSKSDFNINLKQGTVTCPAEITVEFPTKKPENKNKLTIVNFGSACDGCPLRSQCTKSKTGRSISIGPSEAILTEARQRQKDPAWQKEYTSTRPKVERKIGHLMRRKHASPSRASARPRQSSRRLRTPSSRTQHSPTRRARIQHLNTQNITPTPQSTKNTPDPTPKHKKHTRPQNTTPHPNTHQNRKTPAT